VAYLARHGRPLGVPTGGITIDMAALLRHKRDMVRHEVELHTQNFTATGTELIVGHGRFVAPKTLEVTLNGGTRAGRRARIRADCRLTIRGGGIRCTT
jgi:pyruvate/2-oxoglutarate dehydrogenase complex dihydrolipoamide dehydrogenase (E3) component